MHILIEDGKNYFFDGVNYRKINEQSNLKNIKNNTIYSIKIKNNIKQLINFDMVRLHDINSTDNLNKQECKQLIELFARDFSEIFYKVIEESKKFNQIERAIFSDGVTITEGHSMVKVLAAQLLKSYMNKIGVMISPDFERPIDKKNKYLKFSLKNIRDFYCEVNDYEINHR